MSLEREGLIRHRVEYMRNCGLGAGNCTFGRNGDHCSECIRSSARKGVELGPDVPTSDVSTNHLSRLLGVGEWVFAVAAYCLQSQAASFRSV